MRALCMAAFLSARAPHHRRHGAGRTQRGAFPQQPEAPKPLPPKRWRTARTEDPARARQHLVPWVLRRLRHQSSGDGSAQASGCRPVLRPGHASRHGRVTGLPCRTGPPGYIRRHRLRAQRLWDHPADDAEAALLLLAFQSQEIAYARWSLAPTRPAARPGTTRRTSTRRSPPEPSCARTSCGPPGTSCTATICAG